ncbi:hypothetical protein F0562_026497 [Nyssa sinensis]|uniref:Pectinesterase n=1 Tax=Nyssa sinensis TaxID=561372 RepID=A0A5J5B971_9ASTE|nr:hypothetical protein F0562_026497 [Nyssa sinensis]
MATKLGLFLIIYIFYSSFFSLALPADAPPGDIESWCSTTPHPEPCKFFMSHSSHHSAPTQRAGFRTMMVELAMERALHGQTQARQLGQRCRNKRKKAAWRDCLNLFDDTIFHLNRTLKGLQSNVSSDFDAQTWLSSALTSLDTCREVSLQLNVSDFISPLMSNNVSELISNSLAINGVLVQEEEYTDGFPSWVSDGERKLLQSSSLAARANVTVAKDGSGSFRTIQAAINAAAKTSGNERFIIYVKRGVYMENIEIGRNLNNIMLGLMALDSLLVALHFRNTAGPQGGQAVALRSASDLSVFYACSFEGYQDTLFVLSQRQFYKSCYIYGTIDFIFGNAAVVFQNCVIYVRKPLIGQANVITAQGRDDPFQNTGISIHNSRVHGGAGPQAGEGWLEWNNSAFALDTLYYGEYMNFGPGSSTANRVKWGGYQVITSANVAGQFTVGSFIGGRAWLPSTGVPFTAGL